MSFDVFLISSSNSSAEEHFSAEVSKAVVASGGVREPSDEVLVRAPDGADFELHGTMATLRGLTPGIAGILFAIAEATSCFLVPAGEEGLAYRTPGNTGEPPDDFLPIVVVESPEALLTRLNGGHEAWAEYREDQVIADPSPPPSPKRGFFASLFSKS